MFFGFAGSFAGAFAAALRQTLSVSVLLRVLPQPVIGRPPVILLPCDLIGTHSLSRRATSPRCRTFWLAVIFPIIGVYPGVFALPKSTANKMSRPSEEPCRSRKRFSFLVLPGGRAVLNLSSQIAEGICQRHLSKTTCQQHLPTHMCTCNVGRCPPGCRNMVSKAKD